MRSPAPAWACCATTTAASEAPRATTTPPPSQELAEDARAAIDYLETRDDVDPERIGLFGHSEGGFYSAMLGASDPRVACIGMMAPAIIDGVDLHRRAERRHRGVDRFDSRSRSRPSAPGRPKPCPWQPMGTSRPSSRSPVTSTGRSGTASSRTRSSWPGTVSPTCNARLDSELPIYTSDWFRSILGFRPGRRLAPGHGARCWPSSAARTCKSSPSPTQAALETYLAEAGNDDVTAFTIPDANHLFQAAETGAPTEYGRLEPEFIDGFVEAVVDWTVERAGVAE